MQVVVEFPEQGGMSRGIRGPEASVSDTEEFGRFIMVLL